MKILIWLAGLQSRTKATFQMLVIDRLAEVTNDSILQSAPPDDLIRVCGNEDRRNRAPCSDEMSVELKTSHSRHLNVGNQARCCCQERGCQEVGCRRERLGSVAQRAYEFSHGFSKRLIILHDRYQVIFRHRNFGATFAALPMRRACMPLRNVGEGPRQSNAGATKRWLMPSAFRLGKGLFVAARGE